MGKYIRHALAAAFAAVLATGLRLAGVTPDPAAIQGTAEALALALEPMVMLIAYAWSEKAMKRFRRLDPEGAADRLMIKRAADVTP
jgi:hypothetical protein